MLEIGQRDGKLCGVYSNLLTDDEVARLRNAMRVLKDYSLEDRIRWLREHITSFNNAYREITESKVTIEEAHEVAS